MKIEVTVAEIKDHLGVQLNLIRSLFSRPDPFLAPCMIEKLKKAEALPHDLEGEGNVQFIFSSLHRFIDRVEAAQEKITLYTEEKAVEVSIEDLKQYIAERYPNIRFEENLAGLLLSQCSSTIEDFSKKALKKEGREIFSGVRAKRPFMRKYIKKVIVEPSKIEIEVE